MSDKTYNLVDEALVQAVLTTLQYCHKRIDRNKAIEILTSIGCPNYKSTEYWVAYFGSTPKD